MLPNKNRLKKDADFQKTWKRGLSFYTKILGFKILQNNLAVSRFGIVVGTKISKLAVVRNRLKRQIREILHKKIKEIVPGYDLVITVLPAAAGKTSEELEGEINSGLKHFKITNS